MLRTAPALINDMRTLARQLEEEPRARGVARRLAATYKTLRVAAGELGLVHLSRVARGGEVFAQLVSTDAITAVPRHFLMLGEIRLGLSRLVDRVRDRGTDATCSREASHVMNVVLSSEPIVGALLLQRSVLATAEIL